MVGCLICVIALKETSLSSPPIAEWLIHHHVRGRYRSTSFPGAACVGYRSGFSSSRTNLSPFTKDFRGGEHPRVLAIFGGSALAELHLFVESHFGRWSLGHFGSLVTWVPGHLVTRVPGHSGPWSLASFVGHLGPWPLGSLVTWVLGHLRRWSLCPVPMMPRPLPLLLPRNRFCLVETGHVTPYSCGVSLLGLLAKIKCSICSYQFNI